MVLVEGVPQSEPNTVVEDDIGVLFGNALVTPLNVNCVEFDPTCEYVAVDIPGHPKFGTVVGVDPNIE